MKKKRLLRDKRGRFMKRAVKKKPALSVNRSVRTSGGRELIQRYYIDKFRKGKKNEYEVWTIASKGTLPLSSKGEVLKKVELIV